MAPVKKRIWSDVIDSDLRRKCLCVTRSFSYSKGVPRQAVLIFADETHVDLARRSFPRAARPLLNLPALSRLYREIDVHLFSSTVRIALSFQGIHRQSGHEFASRLENAVEKIHGLGYDEVVVIGRDC